MAIKVPASGTVAEKWRRRASAAAPDYAAGIKDPKQSWQTAASAANDNYVTAVTQAASAGKFKAGVAKAGDATWQKGALEKGAARFPQGVTAAESDYNARISEVLTTISGVSLPPRGLKGDPSNYERVRAIGTTLHDKFGGG